MSDENADVHVEGYPTTPGEHAADDYEVRIGDETVFVYGTPVGAFAIADAWGRAPVRIEPEAPIEGGSGATDGVVVRPLAREVEPTVGDGAVEFVLDGPAKLSVEFPDDRRPLFLLVREPPTSVPDPDDPGVRYFEAGRVHRPGVIRPSEGETVYVEGGAILRGTIEADGVSDVSIRGRGIIDGSDVDGSSGKMLRLVGCRDVELSGVTVLNGHDPDGWTVVPIACDRVRMENLAVIGWSANDDGIDIVGSRDVTVTDCFVRTRDDCVAVKATSRESREGDDRGARSVRDVRVEASTFWNGAWGNALEIGYETTADEITGVEFVDCDVIHVEPERGTSGGVFTIHNGDRADVNGVLYEDVRVEDARDKLIDFKVQHSRYSVDERRGRIRDVVLRDVHVVDGRLPPSILQRFDRDHTVENVRIENLRHRGERIVDALDAHLIVETGDDVSFD